MFSPESGLLLVRRESRALLHIPRAVRAKVRRMFERYDGMTLAALEWDDQFALGLVFSRRRRDGSYRCNWDATFCYFMEARERQDHEFVRIATSVIVGVQRRWRSVQRERRTRREALAMALHPRLGADAPIARLGGDGVRLVAARC